MEPRCKLWIEANGRLALSDYRVRLLRLIEETGSLAQAAGVMGLSYRRAWGKVKEIEANLGVALVESESGGAGGGHTRLTAEGEHWVRRYERFRAAVAVAVAEAYVLAFGEEQEAG